MTAHSAPRIGPVPDEANVLIGGFLGSAAGYENLRTSMETASGRHTVFEGLSRRGPSFTPDDPHRHPPIFYTQAVRIVSRLQAQGIRKVRLYGHSLGAPVALVIADAFSEVLEIESVVLLNPACIQAEGLLQLILKTVLKAGGNLHLLSQPRTAPERRILLASAPGAGLYALVNPKQLLDEIMAASYIPVFTTLYPTLKNKVPVYVAYGEEDELFFAGDILATARKMGMPRRHVFALKGRHDCQFLPVQTVETLGAHGVL